MPSTTAQPTSVVASGQIIEYIESACVPYLSGHRFPPCLPDRTLQIVCFLHLTPTHQTQTLHSRTVPSPIPKLLQENDHQSISPPYSLLVRLVMLRQSIFPSTRSSSIMPSTPTLALSTLVICIDLLFTCMKCWAHLKTRAK